MAPTMTPTMILATLIINTEARDLQYIDDLWETCIDPIYVGS